MRFFRERTVCQLNAFFGSTFWSEVVPRIAYNEPSVRHALIALAGFHERFTSGSKDRERSCFGLQQYNLAIRTLLHSNQDLPLVGLLCCLLFISIELLQGRFVSAMNLSKSAGKMLSDLRSKYASLDSSDSVIDLYDVLKAQYLRFEGQATLMQSLIGSESQPPTFFDDPVVWPSPVLNLSSISEARWCFEEIRKAWMEHVWSSQVKHHRLDYAFFSEQLQCFNNAFQELLTMQQRSFSAFDRRSVAILEINRRQFAVALLVAANPPPGQLTQLWWDNEASQFEGIVEHATIALELSGEDELNCSPQFSLEPGVNLHLYSVITRCRDPTIRRRAIVVLRSVSRHEGLWRSDLVAHIGDQIVKLEEEGLNVRSCHDIPDDARIKHVKMQIDSAETKGEVQYTFNGKVSREAISWEESVSS